MCTSLLLLILYRILLPLLYCSMAQRLSSDSSELGEVRWSNKELMGLNIFNPYLASAKVFNHKGVHIADLGPTDIANWFAIKKDGKKLIEFKLRQAAGARDIGADRLQ